MIPYIYKWCENCKRYRRFCWRDTDKYECPICGKYIYINEEEDDAR